MSVALSAKAAVTKVDGRDALNGGVGTTPKTASKAVFFVVNSVTSRGTA